MSVFDGKRLGAETFKLDVARMRRGWYSDKYFHNIVTLLSGLVREGYTFEGQNGALAAQGCGWKTFRPATSKSRCSGSRAVSPSLSWSGWTRPWRC